MSSTTPSLQVLIVNDDRPVCRAFTRILKVHGHRATSVVSVRDAIVHLSRSTYDLVITDDTMPHGHGMELLEHMRDEHPRVPAFMTTASCRDYDPQLTALGYPPAVRLPISMDMLMHYVERATFR